VRSLSNRKGTELGKQGVIQQRAYRNKYHFVQEMKNGRLLNLYGL
jgi:hypothetical protein